MWLRFVDKDIKHLPIFGNIIWLPWFSKRRVCWTIWNRKPKLSGGCLIKTGEGIIAAVSGQDTTVAMVPINGDFNGDSRSNEIP